VILLSGPFPFPDLFANALVIENGLVSAAADATVATVLIAACLNIPMHVDGRGRAAGRIVECQLLQFLGMRYTSSPIRRRIDYHWPLEGLAE